MNRYQAESIRTLREFPSTRKEQIELYRIAYPKARTLKNKCLENCSDEQIRSATWRMYQEAFSLLRFEAQPSVIKNAEQDYGQRLAEYLNISPEEQENYTLSDLEQMMGID